MADAEKIYTFRDPTRLTRMTIWSIYALLAIEVISAISVSYDLHVLQLGVISDSDQIRQGVIVLLDFPALLVAGVLTLVWIFRSCVNAHALTSGAMEFTPGWAVGWNFIPIASLWKPFQAVREIWNVSRGVEGSTESTPTFMRFWWGLWLTGNFAAQISFRLTGVSGAQTMASSAFDLIEKVANVGACVLLIMLIRQVATWQESAGRAESVFA